MDTRAVLIQPISNAADNINQPDAIRNAFSTLGRRCRKCSDVNGSTFKNIS